MLIKPHHTGDTPTVLGFISGGIIWIVEHFEFISNGCSSAAKIGSLLLVMWGLTEKVAKFLKSYLKNKK